jgi:polyisoprenoid-binding protein YceI
VSRQMDTQQFPNATFTAATVTVPATNAATKASLQMSGNLTIHGVTKAVTVSAQAQQVGGKLEVAGSVTIDMTDYGVTPPEVPFTAVDSQTVIEFDVVLARS